mgnify:CR=1 FL=1
MLRDIHHVAFVVQSVDAAAESLERCMGIRFLWRKAFPERGVDLAIYRLGNTFLEVTAPTGPESPLATFLAQRGPGVHHVAFGVTDVAESLAVLNERGCPLLDQRPTVGTSGWTVAPLDTGAVLGVALQMVQLAE